MEFLKQHWTAFSAGIRALLLRLTRPQKLSLAVLALVVVLALILMMTAGGGDRWIALSTPGDPASLAAFRSLLDEHQVPYRVDGFGDSLRIEVPAAQAARARWLAAQGGLFTRADTNLDWLFGERSLLDTDSRIDQRLLESRRRTVEETVRWNRDIRDARIVLQRGPESIYPRRGISADTAAVVLSLRPGVERLQSREASTIRTLVSGAFNIPAQNIQITDDRLNNYAHTDSPAEGSLTEEEDRTRARVLRTIQEIYSRIFRPAEFVVGVLVEVSQRRAEVLDEIYDPDQVATAKTSSNLESPAGGGGSGNLPPAAPEAGIAAPAMDRKDATYENRFSRKTVKTTIPTGEVKNLSVNLVIDRAAIQRILQEEEMTRLSRERQQSESIRAPADIQAFTISGSPAPVDLDRAVAHYLDAQRKFIEGQLPMSGARVQVTTVMFPRSEAVAEPPPPGAAAAWLAGSRDAIWIGALAALGLLAAAWVLRRRRSAPVEIPTLEERIREERSRSPQDSPAASAPGPSGMAGAKAAAGSGGRAGVPGGVPDDLAASIRLASAVSREKPEAVVAVLRTWMSGAASGDA